MISDIIGAIGAVVILVFTCYGIAAAVTYFDKGDP